MPIPLVPCTRCACHVFAHEATCPFCRATLGGAGGLAVVSLALGLALAGCKSDPPFAAPAYGVAPTDLPMPAPPYGVAETPVRNPAQAPSSSPPQPTTPTSPTAPTASATTSWPVAAPPYGVAKTAARPPRRPPPDTNF
jgi:hypothetical protein